MESNLVLSLAIIAFIAAPVAYAVVLGTRMARDDGRVRLFELLGARGLALPDAESEAALRAAAQAARRCVGCAGHEACDRLLAARDWKALRLICPNTDYIDRLGAR